MLALGAGLPRELPIAGSMASGMRQANDFLMALQLSGAHKKNHLVSLQVDLPALVIGGGLTGVDTATEVKTYYIQQIRMIYSRYEYFVNNACESLFWDGIDQENIYKVKVYLEHAKSMYRWIESYGEASINDFIDSIGGVNIVYRKSMQQSPAYRENHQELMHALEEGVGYIENMQPIEAVLGDDGQLVH